MNRGLLTLLAAVVARADASGQVEAALHVFGEPAPSESVAVVTPAVHGRADVTKWLSFDLDWSADVVTGATPRTYGGADVVTGATGFSDVRNELGARVELRRGLFTGRAGYRFGIENDYRSHAVTLGAQLDAFQHNTILALDYAHAFDTVCDLDNGRLSATLRQPLGTSEGCFSASRGLTEEPVELDSLSVIITQVLSLRVIGAIGASWQRVDGFQSNPYRRVRLDAGTLFAQESHPRLRDRGSVSARLRWSVPRIEHGVVGLDARFYNDTWGIFSGTADLSFEKAHFGDRLRWRAHARYYQQRAAFFYRDAGRSNSYERTGAVGQYFTGDRELAPFADLTIGGLIGYHAATMAGHRLGRMFRSLDVTVDLDLVKVFAFSPEPPNHARMAGVIDAIAAGISFIGEL